MSKKKNKKFKKTKERLAVLPDLLGSEAGEKATIQGPGDQAGRQTSGAATSAPVARVEEVDPRYRFIRRDVKKIVLTAAFLFLLLAGTYILGQKTDLLNSLGGWLYKIANIQTQ